MIGFVILHRTLLKNSAFRNEGEAMAFAWMILRASWKPTTLHYKGKEIEAERGQLAMSVRDFASHFDRSKDWAKRLLDRLQARDMIATDTRHGVLLITICNYDKYQADGPYCATDARQPRDVSATQNKEENKGKKEQESVAKATSAFAMPAGVDPEHWRDFLANRKRKRHANTPSAHKRLMDDLNRISAKRGWTFAQLIAHAASHGWAGIYDPLERKSHAGRDEERTGAAVQAVANGFGVGITELEADQGRALGRGNVVALPSPKRVGD